MTMESGDTGTARKGVFISYSRQDIKWLERLQTYLIPLERELKLDIWDDTRIEPGANWRHEIGKALREARVAVMLVSPGFLASDFISTKEVPTLMEAAQNEGITILWVAVSACQYRLSPVTQYQAVNDPAHPLDSLSTAKQGQVLNKIADQIIKALKATPKHKTTEAAVSSQSTDSESSEAPQLNDAAPKNVDKPSIHVAGNVNRGIVGGQFGDNTTINFGDNSGNK